VEHESKDILIRYLLGDLPEQEMERLADEYFVHDEAWQSLRAVESDLIDACVRGELSQDLQEKFTARFMSSPRRWERVEFAKILLNSAVRARARAGNVKEQELEKWQQPPAAGYWMQRPAIRLSLVAAGVLVVALIVIVAAQNKHLRDEVQRIQSTQAELQRQIDIARQQAANRGTGSNDTKVEPLSSLLSQEVPAISIMLSPGIVRKSSESPTLPLTRLPSSIILVLSLDQDRYAAYEAIVKTAGGRLIRHITGLKSRLIEGNEKVVALQVPSRLFRRDDYVVTLFGLQANGRAEPVDSYIFSVSP